MVQNASALLRHSCLTIRQDSIQVIADGLCIHRVKNSNIARAVCSNHIIYIFQKPLLEHKSDQKGFRLVGIQTDASKPLSEMSSRFVKPANLT